MFAPFGVGGQGRTWGDATGGYIAPSALAGYLQGQYANGAVPTGIQTQIDAILKGAQQGGGAPVEAEPQASGQGGGMIGISGQQAGGLPDPVAEQQRRLALAQQLQAPNFHSGLRPGSGWR